MINRYKLRKKDFAFLSESDIHHSFASLLENENVGSVHTEFPIPLEPDQLWAQIERFGKVSFGKGYYKADICILDEGEPQLVSEIRWMPALIPPHHLLDQTYTNFGLAQKKLYRIRKRYEEGIPRWYIDKLLRNFEKFLEVCRRYQEDYHTEGYLCVFDEQCPSIDEQLRKEIEGFKLPDNFHLLADYVE